MHSGVKLSVEDGVLVRQGTYRVDVGDIDQNRNLKARLAIGPGLRPVFEDMQEKLQYREMGIEEGIAVGQYYQEFKMEPRAFGYHEEYQTEIKVSLREAVVPSKNGSSKRLVVETRSELKSRIVTGIAPSVGFTPPLGASHIAARGRVIHMLTKPANPIGERSVTHVPKKLDFLKLHEFEGTFPIIDELCAVPDGFIPTSTDGVSRIQGVWTMANSDVFQHIHAREYLYAMENRMGALAAEAGLPLQNMSALSSRVIYRRPSLVGEYFELRCQLFRRKHELLALGSFHSVVEGVADERPSSYLSFSAFIDK